MYDFHVIIIKTEDVAVKSTRSVCFRHRAYMMTQTVHQKRMFVYNFFSIIYNFYAGVTHYNERRILRHTVL